jgi:spore germination protein YaaH
MPFARQRAALSQAHPLGGGNVPSPRQRLPHAALLAILLVVGLGIVTASRLPAGTASPGGTPIAASGGAQIGGPGPGSPPAPQPGHEVYGYVPYWEMDAGIAAHLADTQLTTLALFSVTHKATGAMATTQTGYKRITGTIGRRLIRDAHERGTRVELVYTSFGERKNSAFYNRPEAQERWIGVLVDFVEEHGLDGVNVDVELLPADLIPAYGAWVGRLREALRERLPEAQVSVATTAGERGAAMALAASTAGADRIFVMGYDYHYPGSQPGASAPLDRLDGNEKDLAWTLDRYAALGVPAERTILGLPLYGVTWPVAGPDLGAPATGDGDTWVPRRNLPVFDDDTFEPTYDPIESVEFYVVPSGEVTTGGDPEGSPGTGNAGATEDPEATDPGSAIAPWNAVYYDSPRSLRPKLALADERGLAGAGFWAIGYERGLPGYSELIAAFRAGEIDAEAQPDP